MRRRKLQTEPTKSKKLQVRVRECPCCHLGQVVSKKDTFAAYHTKHYAQLRKEKKLKSHFLKPTVGTRFNIEGVLLLPKFPKALAPSSNTKFVSIFDSKYYKLIQGTMIVLTMIVSILVSNYLKQLGEDMSRRSPVRAAISLFTLGLVLLFFWLLYLYDEYRERKFAEDKICNAKLWLCLRCGVHQ
jgi:hypothetical protein